MKKMVLQYALLSGGLVYFRLHEFDEQTRWVREGMAKVIPVPLLALFTGLEIETMVGLVKLSGW